MARSRSSTTVAEAKNVPQQPEQESVTLVGRLVRDPELRQTKSGKSVTTIRIAVNPPEGEATFHSVVVWNRTAEVVCEYLRKGRLVEVVGREQERSYTAGDGAERTVNEILAFRVEFLSRQAETTATSQTELS